MARKSLRRSVTVVEDCIVTCFVVVLRVLGNVKLGRVVASAKLDVDLIVRIEYDSKNAVGVRISTIGLDSLIEFDCFARAKTIDLSAKITVPRVHSSVHVNCLKSTCQLCSIGEIDLLVGETRALGRILEST